MLKQISEALLTASFYILYLYINMYWMEKSYFHFLACSLTVDILQKLNLVV